MVHMNTCGKHYDVHGIYGILHHQCGREIDPATGTHTGNHICIDCLEDWPDNWSDSK